MDALRPITAVVFDLDGTLIDSLPDVCAALNRVLAEDGRRPLTLAEVRAMVGEGATVTVEKALRATGTPGDGAQVADVLARYLESYRGRPAEHTVVYPGAIDVLQRLRADGVAMGICTNKPHATTLPVLAALDLDGYFAAVSCGDSVPHRKPDGRHVALTLEGMGAAHGAALMVGDSETDIRAARDAGVIAVAVTYGYSHVPVETLGADALIDHLGALPDLMRRLAAPATELPT